MTSYSFCILPIRSFVLFSNDWHFSYGENVFLKKSEEWTASCYLCLIKSHIPYTSNICQTHPGTSCTYITHTILQTILFCSLSRNGDKVSFLCYPFKYIFQKIQQKNEGGYILSHVYPSTWGVIPSKHRVIGTCISHVVYFSEFCNKQQTEVLSWWL